MDAWPIFAALTAPAILIFGPIAASIVSRWTGTDKPKNGRNGTDGGPSAVSTGQTVDLWNARLVADLDREQTEHRQCHSVMRSHNIGIPHD